MKTSLRPTKRAWERHGMDRVIRFPHYSPRLPRLAQLFGVYPIEFSLPSWWKELVIELQARNLEEPLIELFRGATSKEFRVGQFETRRHKELRSQLSESAKRLISSPRIGKFLLKLFGVNHPFMVSFNNRGDKLREKEIVITGDPWDIVTMATRGKSWTSCQDYLTGGYRQQVWANLSDSGMAIVYVRTRGDQSEKDMDTRVVLRYFWTYRRRPEEASIDGIVLDRFYGDASYIRAIQDLVSRIARDYAFVLFEYERYNSHQQGMEVRRVSQTTSEVLTVRGPSVNFRGVPLPWMDNAKWKQERKRRGFHRLEAKVRPVNPDRVNVA